MGETLCLFFTTLATLLSDGQRASPFVVSVRVPSSDTVETRHHAQTDAHRRFMVEDPIELDRDLAAMPAASSHRALSVLRREYVRASVILLQPSDDADFDSDGERTPANRSLGPRSPMAELCDPA